MNFKKFVNTFRGQKMLYEFYDDTLLLASPQMIMALPCKAPVLPVALEGEVQKAHPGELLAIMSRQEESFSPDCFTVASETGLTFSLMWKNKNLPHSILLVEPEDEVPSAIYVREDYLKILGSEFSFLGVNDSRNMIVVGGSSSEAPGNFLAYIILQRLSTGARENLQAIAAAILNANKEKKIYE